MLGWPLATRNTYAVNHSSHCLYLIVLEFLVLLDEPLKVLFSISFFVVVQLVLITSNLASTSLNIFLKLRQLYF